MYDAHQLVGGHGEIFFFRDRAKPLLSERITLGCEPGNLGPEFLMRERIGQARETTDRGRAAIGNCRERGVGQGRMISGSVAPSRTCGLIGAQ